MPLVTTSSEILLALPPSADAPRLARRALHERGLGEDMDHAVTLLVTEIVTNAVRHAELGSGDRITFFASLTPDHVRVEIHDPGSGFNPTAGHEGRGFGLRLVDKLSSRWGVDCAKGCRVWFEVDQRRRRFERG
jgi:two-component sensor histidine kinase